MVPDSMGCKPAMDSKSSFCPLPAIPATPSISPLYAVKVALSKVLTPSLFTQVTPCTSRRFRGLTGSGRSMFRLTFLPTIISVRDSSVASAVCTVPMYWPLRSTETRSDSASTSWSLWVMMMMEWPASRMLRRTAKRRSVSWGVRTAVGSSRIRMSTPRYRSLTISTVCFWDTDMVYIFWSGSKSKPYLPVSSLIRAATLFMSRISFPERPRMMFSAAVRTSTSLKCWWIMPIPSANESLGERMATSFPFTYICPSSG